MVFSLVACGNSSGDSLADKIALKLLDEVTDKASITVDTTDGGKITIGDGEDQLVIDGSEDGMRWSGDKLPANVPELKTIKVLSVVSSDNDTFIAFAECDKDEAFAYKDLIINSGWVVKMDMLSEEGGMITTSNDAGEAILFVWDLEEQSGAITYTSADE